MFHKLLAILPLMLMLHSVTARCQNQEPVIANVKAEHDPAKGKLTISYDLTDMEESKLEVSLLLFAKGADHYRVIPDSVEGDVGFPVSAGKKRTISCYFSKKALPAGGLDLRLVADDHYRIGIQHLVNQVDSIKLRNALKTVYGPREQSTAEGKAHLEKVRDFIENSWKEYRLSTYRQDTTLDTFRLGKVYEFHNLKVENVIAHLPGLQNDSITYILCGHFDTSKDSPGADDNGSGIAGMLEAARILSKYHFERSIKFVALDLEEIGFLGSRFYVFGGGIKKNEIVRGVLNFDMIGYYSDQPNTQIVPEDFDLLFPEVVKTVAADQYRGNFIINTANDESKELGKKFAISSATYVPDLKVVSLVAYKTGSFTPQLAASDHSIFWGKGYEALHIGDGGDTRNRLKDTFEDTEDIVNYTFMSKVVKAAVATLADMAGILHCTVYEWSIPAL